MALLMIETSSTKETIVYNLITNLTCSKINLCLHQSSLHTKETWFITSKHLLGHLSMSQYLRGTWLHLLTLRLHNMGSFWPQEPVYYLCTTWSKVISSRVDLNAMSSIRVKSETFQSGPIKSWEYGGSLVYFRRCLSFPRKLVVRGWTGLPLGHRRLDNGVATQLCLTVGILATPWDFPLTALLTPPKRPSGLSCRAKALIALKKNQLS